MMPWAARSWGPFSFWRFFMFQFLFEAWQLGKLHQCGIAVRTRQLWPVGGSPSDSFHRWHSCLHYRHFWSKENSVSTPFDVKTRISHYTHFIQITFPYDILNISQCFPLLPVATHRSACECELGGPEALPTRIIPASYAAMIGPGGGKCCDDGKTIGKPIGRPWKMMV